MHLTFHSITICNFGCFGGTPQWLHFDKLRTGLHFLAGNNKLEPALESNGAGKSTVLNAFRWCIYGSTSNGLASTDIKPWAGKGRPQVTLSFNVDDIEHQLVRYADPGMIKLGDGEASQRDIEKLIQLPVEVFEHTVMLGQGKPLFFDLANRDKLALLSEVLGLDRWEKHSSTAAQRVDMLNRDLATNEASFMSAENLIEHVRSELKAITEQSDEWEDKRTRLADLHKKELAETSTLLEKAKDRFANVDVTYDGLGTTLSLTRKDAAALKMAADKAKRKLDNAQVSLSSNEAVLEQLHKELLQSDGKTCPVCKQKVKGNELTKHNHKLKGEIEERRQAIDTIDIKAAQAAMRTLTKRQALLDEIIEEHQQKVDKLEPEHRLLHQEVTRLTTKLAVLADQNYEQANPYREQQVSLNKKLRMAKAKKKEAADYIELLKKRIARASYWVKGFKDIRLFVLEEILYELTLTTNGMLPQVGLHGWNVAYAVERETKSGTTKRELLATVTSPGSTRPVKWSAWSGGEAQRLRLVGAMALSQVLLGRAGVTSNLEVLDEPGRHMSSRGIDDLCTFLAQRARELKRKIVLVDHMSIENSNFRSTIMVTKTKHGAVIDTVT